MSQIIVIPIEELKSILKEVISSALPYRDNDERTDSIFDVREAASYLKISMSSLYSLTSKREIPHFKRGKKLYFKQDELVLWISEGKRKSIRDVLSKIQ